MSANDFYAHIHSFRRRYKRGAWTWTEYMDAVVRQIVDTDPDDLAVVMPEWLEDQRDLKGDSDDAMTLDDLVKFAAIGYTRIAEQDRKDGQPPQSRGEVWALIDKNLPWLHAEALDYASRAVDEQSALEDEDFTFDYPGALDYLPDSAHFRNTVDVLDSRYGLSDDLDARLALLELRKGAGSFNNKNAVNSAALHLVSVAVKSGDRRIVMESGALLEFPLDSTRTAQLEEIVDFAVASARDFSTLISLLVLCGYAQADNLVRRLSDVVDSIDWPSLNDPEPDYQFRLQGTLGRASVAAYFANAWGVAVRFAALQLEGDEGGWWNTGESLLAVYVLTRNETDVAKRYELLRRGAEGARHGNVHPLFAQLYLDAARAAFASGDLEKADLFSGYGVYLHRTRTRVEGHLWNPMPIVQFARRVPFDVNELVELYELIRSTDRE